MSVYSESALCQCGCGLPAPVSRQHDTKRGYRRGEPKRFRGGHNYRRQPARDARYKQTYAPGHPNASGGVIFEHVLIAASVLGHALPARAHVHHVDGNGRNNAHTNLVICEDLAYHKLLHYRTKVRAFGGNPNTEKWCGDCHQIRLLTAFNVMRGNKSTGRQSVCRECSKRRDKAKQRQPRETRAEQAA